YPAALGNGFEGRFNATGRAYPDVAAQGYKCDLVYQGEQRRAGRTSFATSVFESVVTLLNDRLAGAGLPPLRFMNP
ncbi:hypothetical protein BD413DRAFT_459911, partial [Trametes elegans]